MRKTKIEKKIKSKRHTCFKREGEIMAAEKQKIQKREGEKEESSATKYDIQSIHFVMFIINNCPSLKYLQ